MEPFFFFLILFVIVIVIIVTKPKEDKDAPKRRTVTRIVDIDGRVYYRGAPPEEWEALEEEYRRREKEKYYRK